MNYRKIYNDLIERARHRQIDPGIYCERHHIIPRCLGGSDEPENIAVLLASEHRFAHLCLVKIYPDHPGLVNAAVMMNTCMSSSHSRSKSKQYHWLRKRHSESMSALQAGERNSQFGTVWIHSIVEKQSLKIQRSHLDHYLASGWLIGRVINFNKIYRVCEMCNAEFIHYRNGKKTCSDACAHALSHKNRKVARRMKKLCGREQEFLDLYREYRSMNKSLKVMVVCGAVSGYYRWAKDLVDKQYGQGRGS